MKSLRNRRQTRRPARLALQLEALEDRTLLSAAPTLLDLNGLGINTSSYSSTDILVRFQTPPGSPGGPAILPGTSLGAALPLVSGLYQVNLSPTITVAQALAAYKAEQSVLDAERDYHLSVASVPNDPLLSQQWNLNNTGQNGGTPGADIHAEQAWSVANSSPGVAVAVMDTGIDLNNPDLVDNIWINQAEIPNAWYTKSSVSSGYDKLVYKSEIQTATPGVITFRDLNNPVNAGLVWKSDGNSLVDPGDLLRATTQGGWEYNGNTQDGDTAHPNDFFGWNFVANTNDPFDDNGHGTNVAGILGAVGNNGVGVAGVDWNVQMMPIKFIAADGSGTVSNFIQGLNYSIQHGAHITNNSWEGAPYSAAFYDAISNAQQHGQIFVAAAGNEAANNDNTSNYPASFSKSFNNVVAVAATDNTDKLASFSNYGPLSVALAAPGVNILNTLPNNQYGEMSGTSMAAPEVAGAMALVWGQHPGWTYTQVINQVLSTVDKLPSLQGKVSTSGRLDVAAAVGWTLSTTTAPAITSVTPEGATPNSMDSLLLTFNEAIDVSSFQNSAVTLTGPNGSSIPVTVNVLANSGDRQVQLLFANQTTLGNYQLSINSSVRNLMGVAMAPYSCTITLHAPQTYTTNTATAIGPQGLAMSSIVVPPGATVGSVQVKLNISYPIDDNLYVYLIAPSGKTIALDYNRGGTGANLTSTNFSESASTPISAGKAPFTGTFIPEVSLSQLAGLSAGGTWRLAVRNYGSSKGSLLNWSLTITPASKTTTTTTTNNAVPQTYTHSTATAIGPKGLAMSSIVVPPGAKVGSVQVKLNVSYPIDNNLYVYLIAPNGKTIALDYNRGGTGSNLTSTNFSESASTPISAGKAPFTGTFIPEVSLSQLAGLSAGGTWRLAVRNYGYDSGSLLNWSLTITPAGSIASVKVSSVGDSLPSVPTSSPTTANVNTPHVSAVGGPTGTLPVPSPLVNGSNNPTLPASSGDGFFSYLRSLAQFLTGWLAGKRPGQNPSGNGND